MVLNTIQDEMKEAYLEAKTIQYDPDDSLPTYIGINNVENASDDAEDWRIYKFYYSGTAVTKIIKHIGKWTDRASYFP